MTQPDPLGSRRFARITTPLRETEQPLRAILVAAVLSLSGSVVLAAIQRLVVPGLESPTFPSTGWNFIAAVVLIAPLVETAIMAILLELLLRLVRPRSAILLSAAGWGIAHSSVALGWGFVIWWPFLIFSTLYVSWRRRSLFAAYAVPCAAHALQNAIPALLMVR